MQGKLQGRLMEFSTPQPIDECLAILGESMVRATEVTAVIGVYAKAVKDGEVHSLLPLPLPVCIVLFQGLRTPCLACATVERRCVRNEAYGSGRAESWTQTAVYVTTFFSRLLVL